MVRGTMDVLLFTVWPYAFHDAVLACSRGDLNPHAGEGTGF
jgi:hypothetical protein